jgi:hypothetical protein
MPTATQKTDTGLTMGLLKVLHKQVNINSNEFYKTFSFVFSSRLRVHYP